MKTNTAPKSHQAERSEAQPQSPLAEAPSEEISEARLNQLAKDYSPSIERAITAFNREIEHYLFSDDATEPARAQPGVLTLPTSTPAPGTPPLSCLNAQEGTSQDVYESLRNHQPTRHEKLLLARTYLPLIIERFYGGNLPLPVLSWYRAHWRNFCSWHVQLDDLGLSHWININLLHLGRPLAEILRGLTHELGNEHEFLYDKPAKRPYHSKAFQNRMREIGIPCNKRGVSLGLEEPFLGFLKELGIEADIFPFKRDSQIPPEGSNGHGSRSGSRLKPWACKCPKAKVWASIKVELDATCHRCGSSFQRQ